VSDFLFTSTRQPPGRLSRLLDTVHVADPPAQDEFHGDWGSLAVVRNHFRGLAPHEDDDYILAILGGPLVTLPGAPGPSPSLARDALTRFVLEAWKRYGVLRWERDLSGPFLAVRVDKTRNRLEIVTDLLSLQPLYHAVSKSQDRAVVLGSQPNLVAAQAGMADDLDLESLADFIISGSGTYPYTLYRNVRQLPPGHIFQIEGGRLALESSLAYWLPFEEHRYENIGEAARDFRRKLAREIERITAGLDRVGILLSGGEDSRTVLSLIPGHVEKTAFTFTDSLNREARTARAAARIHAARWVWGRRSPTYYLDHFEAAARLVGVQAQPLHVHAIGLSQSLGLHRFEAVLGGMGSGTLYKGTSVPRRERKVGNSLVLPTSLKELSIPKDFFYIEPPAVLPKAPLNVDHRLFKPRFVEAVIARRREHYERVKSFRPTSATEWMQHWPANHLADRANLFGHSRLFRNYEPFLAASCVRLVAAVPQEWTLDSRLFQRAFRRQLLRSWRLPNSGTGQLPAFGLWANLIPTAFIQQYRKARRVVLTRGRENQGPWPVWSTLLKSEAMRKRIEPLEPYFEHLAPMLNHLSYADLFDGRRFSVRQQFKFYRLLRLFQDLAG